MGVVIGSFGRELAVDEDPDLFEWHGIMFEVPARVSVLPLMRFAFELRQSEAVTARSERAARMARSPEAAAEAARAKSEAEMAAMAAMHSFMKAAIGHDQWDRFAALADEYGDGIDDVMRVVSAIYEAITGRPTRRSADSSAGPSPSGSGSPGDSVSTEPTPGPTPDVVALRPDRAAINGLLVPAQDAIRSYV